MNEASPTLAELKEELLPAMGAALIKLQFFELYVSGCLLALSDSGHHAINDLLSGDAARRAPTLGILVSELRRVMPLDSQFEDRLGAFIKNRNFFIHRFFVPDIARPAPAAEADVYEKLSFILTLMREADVLKPIFCGLYSLLHKAQLNAGEITVGAELAQYAREMEIYERQFLSILKSTKG
jgi:hypothetical protein